MNEKLIKIRSIKEVRIINRGKWKAFFDKVKSNQKSYENINQKEKWHLYEKKKKKKKIVYLEMNFGYP